MQFSRRALGLAAAVVTVAIWTGFIVVGRASAAHTLLPIDIAFVRIVGAALVAVPWAWWLAHRSPQARATSSLGGFSPLPLRETAAIGAAGGLIYSFLCYAGFFYAPVAHASVLLPGSQPLWAALLAIPLLHEALTRARLASLACIILGGAVVGGASLHTALAGGSVWKGDVFFLSASIFWALYGVLTRRFRLDPVRATLAMAVFGAFTFVPVFLLLVASGVLPTALARAPWHEIAAQSLFQGVCVVIVAGVTFVTMIQTFGAVRSTMITALVPGLSALGGMVFLGEPMAWNGVAGVALVTLGIFLGVRQVATAPGGLRPGPALCADGVRKGAP